MSKEIEFITVEAAAERLLQPLRTCGFLAPV
jgi:hypothetical protein